MFVGWVCFSWNPSSLGAPEPQHHLPDPARGQARLHLSAETTQLAQAFRRGVQAWRTAARSSLQPRRGARETAPEAPSAPAGGWLQGPARHRASCWVKAWAAPPAPRGSDDCAVPRATKFESAGRARPRPAPLRAAPGASAQVSRGLGAPSVAGAPRWSSEAVRAGAWPRWRGRGGPGWARRAGRWGAAGAAGRELGGRCREGARRSGPRPGLRPRGRRFAPGLQTALAVGGPLQVLPIREEGCRKGAYGGLRPRRGATVSPQPLPVLPGGSVLFLFAALGEVAGRKLKELSPHFSLLFPPVT